MENFLILKLKNTRKFRIPGTPRCLSSRQGKKIGQGRRGFAQLRGGIGQLLLS